MGVAEKLAGMRLQDADLLGNLVPEILFGRRIGFNHLPAAKDFGGNDEAGGHREPETLQLHHIQALVAQKNDPVDAGVGIDQGSHRALRVIVQQTVQAVLGNLGRLVKQRVENAAQE